MIAGIVVQKQCAPLSNRFALLLVYSRDRRFSSSSLHTRSSLSLCYPFVPIEGTPFSHSYLVRLSFSSFISLLCYFTSSVYFSLLHHRKQSALYIFSFAATCIIFLEKDKIYHYSIFYCIINLLEKKNMYIYTYIYSALFEA